MGDRRARTIARVVWVVSILMAVAEAVLVFMARHVHASPGFGFPGFDVILTVTFGTVGALITTRQPTNPIGWILAAVGLESGIQGLGLGYALNGILGPHAPWPAASVGAWLNAWFWFPAVILVGTLLLQLFPTGTFLSPRWRTVGWITVGLMTVASIALAITPGPLENFAKITNPFGVHSQLVTIVGNIGFLASNVVIVVSAASLVVRYRRAPTLEREQIKWLAYAGAAAAVVIPAGDLFFTGRSKAGEVAVLLSILFIPIAIGIAVLRYRLYDIDRIISRTVSYAILTAFLGALFTLVVLVPTAVIGSGKTPGWLVAIATLVAFGLFRPLRRRIQNGVDHRFNRARYDIERTLDAFSAKMREQVDLSTVTEEIRDVLNRTMQPQTVSLWLAEKA